MFDLRS